VSDGTSSKLAPAPIAPAPSPALPPAREPKIRKPPPKVRDAIHAYVSGRKQKLPRQRPRGSAVNILSVLFRCLTLLNTYARAAREVATSAGRAAARLNQLIDSGSERVAFEATRFSLGVAGIRPSEDARVSVSIELKAGYVIDLSEPGEPAAKIVGGQVIDAKPVE
jgi:hypothetical protein